MFESVTIFVLASEETVLLRQTIKRIQGCCSSEDVDSIVIVLKSNDCPSYYEADRIIENNTGIKIEKYVQKSDTVVRCIAELPPLAKGSHFVIMASDSEMEPESLRIFIERAKLYPQKIICAAKWHKDSVVEDYGFFHETGSRITNGFVRVLYLKRVYDPFSIFQIYPVSVYKNISYKNVDLFPYEYTLIPLRLNYGYEEIPTVYKKRTEGKSNFNLLSMVRIAIDFCYAAIKIRFTPKRLLHEEKDN